MGSHFALGSTPPRSTEGFSVYSEIQNDHKQQHSASLTDQTNLLPFKKAIVCFIGLALCILVSTLDSIIIATGIPTISAAFDAGAVASWVPTAYLLTSTSFQLLYGRLSDIFGRKAAISVAMLVFMVGNLLAGFSRTIKELIISRGIAGAGGGGIISMAQIVISDIVSLRDRGKYQGIIGIVIALGYTVGPLIGGSLAQNISWRWCFWICIPVAGCATSVVVFILPLKPVKGSMTRKLLVVDFFGAVLTLVGCTLVILPLIWGGVTFPWGSAFVLSPLLSGCLVIVLFCIWEWKGPRLPIVPMYIFKYATLTGVYITMFINGFVFFSSLSYLPQYFQVALGYDPIGAGILLIPLLVSQMAVSWISGIIVSHTGRYRNIIHSGFIVWSIACGLTSTFNRHSQKAEIIIFMLLAGSGVGQTLQTTVVAAQASVSRSDMAVVTAFRNFVRLLGGTLSLPVGATILNNSLRSAMSSLGYSSELIIEIIDKPALLSSPTTLGISPSDATFLLDVGYTRGFRRVFIFNAALTALATLASVILIKHKELNRGDENELGHTSALFVSKNEVNPRVTFELAKGKAAI
ncbi:Efflux pump dotC [Psilocybe cubensis]|uniref:Major facilitator superfamily (MFS) profile domain-containing protein n=2 Tax=Psilocybe cubensis TaxID=181762 RepID=A0A8H7Y8X3_PSICU|nr:Efflux pump dotC [Psilocybe cubensis]KAH9485879.1 Efflux pump dotC [Psilocybe cubensis]